MKFEGFPSQESAPETGEQDLQRLSTEIMSLIQQGEFDAAEEKISTVENGDRKNQLKTILTFEKMRKGARKTEEHQDEEPKLQEHLEESVETENDGTQAPPEPQEHETQREFIEPKEIPTRLMDDLWAAFAEVEGTKSAKNKTSGGAEKTKRGTQSRFTQHSIDEHRTRIQADETLSEKTKKELSNLVDELQEIKKGLNMKSFSPKEAAEKRRRANDILGRLSTGAEKGVTKEKINEILAERASAVEDKEGIVPEAPPVPEAATLPHEVVTEGETSRVESDVQLPVSEKTPKEIIDEWLMSGKVVKVERTGGGVEDGWRVARLYENGAAVLSPDQSVIKKVPFEKLIAWQDLDVTEPQLATGATSAEKHSEKIQGEQETGSMSPSEIESEIKQLIGERVTVHSLSVSGASNGLYVDARFKVPIAGDVGLSAVIVSDEMGLHFTNITVDAQRFRGRVESEIESILPKVAPKIQEHLEVAHKRDIDRLWIEDGVLKFAFKPETAGAIPAEPEVGPDAEAEIKKTLDTIPEKERPSFVRRVIGMGLSVQEQKNKGFAFAYDWAAEKYAGGETPEGTLGRFLKAASENYTRAAQASKTKKEALYEKKGGGVRAGLELARSGALIMRATDPFRWFYPLRSAAAALMVAGRYGDIVKEARLKNEEVLAEKTRIQDVLEAENEADHMYRALGKEFGDSSVSAEELKKAYLTTLPEHLLERLEKGGITSSVLNFGTKYSVERIKSAMEKLELERPSLGEAAYKEKAEAVMEKNRELLSYLDRVVTDAGTMDMIAETGRRAGVWSNRIATVLAMESLVEGIANIVGHLGDHEEVASAVEKLGQPVQSSRELAERAGETEGLDLSHVEAPEVPPEPTLIEKGGNIWSAAKEISEKAGLSKEQFRAAWEHSTVVLSDGREIPISDLNLVHEGDALAYIPGEHGEAGHFEFNNGSEIPYGDATSLPGAEEVGEISHEDFEQKPWEEEPIHVDTFEQAPWQEETADGTLLQDAVAHEPLTDSAGDALPAETTEYFEPQPISEGWTLQERVAYEFNRDMWNIFGDVDPERSEWQQWKGISAKKFMEYRLEEQTPAHSLLIYLKVLMRESHLHPIGGLFRREEKIGDFVERALMAIVAKESQQ